MHAIGRPLLPPGPTSPMAYRDLRDFIAQLETTGELKRVHAPVDPRLEMTALCDRALRAHGPALLFESPVGDFRAPGGATIPVLGNLFGTPRARRAGDGRRPDELASVPARHGPPARVPEGARAAEEPRRRVAQHAPAVHEGARHGAEGATRGTVPGRRVGGRRRRSRAAADADVLAGRCGAADHLGTDGHARPAQEAAESRHLPPAGDRRATRSSCAGSRTAAARWIFATTRWRHPGAPFPIAVALGADPATILGAVTPVPDTLSEYQFAGHAARRPHGDRQVPDARPAGAGVRRDRARRLSSTRRERSDRIRNARRKARSAIIPGYYNEVERFPVFTIERITMRRDPIYHSTYTGKPPDEPAMLGRGAERSVRAAAAKAISRRSPISTCRPRAAATGSPSCR